VEVPSRRYIKVKHELGSIPFFLENSTITIKTTLEKYPEAEISGSKTQSDYEDYLSEKKKYGTWNTYYYYLINRQGKFAGKFRRIEKIEDKLDKIIRSNMKIL